MINLSEIEKEARKASESRALGFADFGCVVLRSEVLLAMVAAIRAAQEMVDSFDPISRTDARQDLRQALQPFSEPT